MQCQAAITTSLSTFTFLDLEKDVAYEAAVTGQASQKLTFNYCTYGVLPDESYGYVLDSSASVADFVVADKRIPSTGVEELRDENNDINGATFTQKSSNECKAADETAGTEAVNYSMVTNVMCDETITGAGTAEVVSVTVADCVYTVTLKHDAGCPGGLDIDDELQWLAENEWAIGILYLIVGPLLALFGAAWFPYVVASLIAVFTIGLICSLSLAAGWMATGTGTAIVMSVAIIVGILVGVLVRR